MIQVPASTLLSVLALAHLLPPATVATAVPSRRSIGNIPRAPFSVPVVGQTQRRSVKTRALESKCPSIASLAGANFNLEYLANVTLGGQSFNLVIDSGSADTWVPDTNFTCRNITGAEIARADCALGSIGFNASASRTFEQIPGVSFNITYGTGEIVAGPLGRETVSVGGLEVEGQIIATPTSAYLLGDGAKSGILGLAMPDQTSMFNVSDPTAATPDSQIPYDPFFVRAFKQNLVDKPCFSIALNRGTTEDDLNSTLTPDLGMLAFGGIAPVPVIPDSEVTVPIHGIVAENGTDEKFYWYAVTIDSYHFPGSEGVPAAANGSFTPGTTILDTGTALNILPDPVVVAYAATFDPPATLTNITEGLRFYTTSCNATVPEFSVTIGGTNFAMDARDQLRSMVVDEAGTTVCVLGTQSSGGPGIPGSFFLLGDTFLHNVVTTFNPIDKEVTLTQREPY